MIKAIFNGLMTLVQNILNVVFLPINLIFASIFPDFSTQVSNFNNSFGNMLNRFGGYIGGMIPPATKTIIILWLTFLIAYYGIIWTYWLAVRTWSIIKKIKFW